MKSPNHKDRIKRFFKTDRAILIISISIALVFWFMTKMEGEFKTSREVNLLYILPDGKIFLNTPPQKINAEIQGGGWNLFYTYLRGMTSDITFRLDSNAVQNISSTNIINKLSSHLGSSYKVVNVDRNIVTIKLDKSKQKKVPVELDVEIKAKNGFMQADTVSYTPREF